MSVEPGSRELDRPATPGTVVPCPLKNGAQIAVGRCVEWQDENGCHCEFALVSLGLVKELVEAETIFTGDSKPGAELRIAALEADRDARLAKIRDLTARAKEIETARPPPIPKATPAEPPGMEMTVLKLDDADDVQFRGAFQKLSGNYSALAKHFYSSVYHVKRRIKSLGLTVSAPARTLGDVAKKHTEEKPVEENSAPNGTDLDVVQALETRRQRYFAEATRIGTEIARIDKALAALRE